MNVPINRNIKNIIYECTNYCINQVTANPLIMSQKLLQNQVAKK